MQTCPNCGEQMPVAARFCGGCGHAMPAAAAPAGSAPVSAPQATTLPAAPDPWQYAAPVAGVGAPGYAPAPAAAPPGPSDFSRRARALTDRLNEFLRWSTDGLPVAAKTAGISLVVLLVASMATSAAVEWKYIESFSDVSVLGWFRYGVAVSALTVGGRLDLGNDLTFQFIPVLLLLVLLVTAFRSARRLGRSLEPASTNRAAQIGIAAAAMFAVAHTILMLLTATDGETEVVSTGVSTFSARGLFGGLLAVGLAAWAGSVAAEARQAGQRGFRERLQGTAMSGFLQACTFLIAMVLLSAVVIPVWFVTGPGKPLSEMAHVDFWLLVLVGGPTVLLAAAGLMVGGTLVSDDMFGATVGRDGGVLVGGAPGLLIVATVAALVIAVLVGLRFAYRVAPLTGVWQAAWVAPAFAVSVWLLLSQVARIDTGLGYGSMAPDPLGDVQLGVPSVVFAGTAWTFLGLVIGRWSARLVAASFPRVARRLAGNQIDENWRADLEERRAARRRPEESALGAGMPVRLAALVLLPVIAGLVLLPARGLDGCGNAVTASFKADRAVPSTQPPADIAQDWADQQLGIDAAQKEADDTARAAAPARKAQDRIADLQSDISVQEDILRNAEDAVSSASDRVDSALDDVSYAQSYVDDAQYYYDLSIGWDNDPYWLQDLNDAKAALQEAQNTLDAARSDLYAAQSDASEAQAKIDSLQAEVTPLQDKVDRDAGKLVAATRAAGQVTNLQVTLDRDKETWQTQNQAARDAAESFNDAASQCRTNGRVHLVPAAVLTTLLAGLALVAVGRGIGRRRGADEGGGTT